MAAVCAQEDAINEAEQKMYVLLRSGTLMPQAIMPIIKIEMIKASDLYFIKTGFEHSDIEPNVIRHELKDSQEIKEILVQAL